MEQLKLNMIPNGVNPVFHASQYDKGRQIRFVIDETLSGAEVTTSYRAKDGTEYGNVQTSVSGNTITDTIPEEVLTAYGIIGGEVNIDGIGSLNFFVEVEKDAYDGGVITTQTASGPIATFETNIETAFVSLKSDINPVQDLHGYSKPWSGGGGKNKLNYDVWKTTTIAGGTAVWENNGVTLTATANDCFTRTNVQVPVTEGETITLSWEETTNKSGNVFIFPNGITTGMVSTNNASHKKLSYTATSGITFVTFRFGVANSGDTIAYKNIQIEKGSQATSWEPYENICPISGFSALNVTLADENMQTVDTATVNFGQTVYGGVADVTNGKVTVTHGIVDLGTMSWVKQETNLFYARDNSVKSNSVCICDSYAYQINSKPPTRNDKTINTSLYFALHAISIYDTDYNDVNSFKASLSGKYCVYELATPIEITTTPENLTALSGQTNNVYSDTNGDTEVEYYIEV